MSHSGADGGEIPDGDTPGDETSGEGPGGMTGDAGDGDNPAVRAKAKKAPSAFRTISEVADELHIPQHVLRFWETKFPQVKPLKRGGGRRYYRPDDITLLRRISDLLYIQGYTIKGVQRLLREGGGKLSDNIPPPAPEERETTDAEADAEAAEPGPAREPMLPMPGLAPSAASNGQPRTGVRARTDPRPAAQTEPQSARPDPETERLRAVLAEILNELEAIRATLG
jgi:DNA-binding transcriptional MerR regulator